MPPPTGAAAWIYRSAFGVPSGPIGRVGALVLPFVNARVYSLILKESEVGPDDDLLDVGCGSGRLLQLAAGARYVAGLEASTIQLGLARKRLAGRLAAGTAELAHGDAAALPWGDGRFSVATSLNCLGFLPDPDQALREMLRVLRPGGRALIVIDGPVGDPAKSGRFNAIGERRWTLEGAASMVQRAGFDRVTATHLPASQLGLLMLRGAKASQRI